MEVMRWGDLKTTLFPKSSRVLEVQDGGFLFGCKVEYLLMILHPISFHLLLACATTTDLDSCSSLSLSHVAFAPELCFLQAEKNWVLPLFDCLFNTSLLLLLVLFFLIGKLNIIILHN